MRRFAATLAALAVAGLLATSCAYYNTFYLARKYYLKGTEGRPYVVGKSSLAGAANFRKSVEYSKKLIAQYPKSKWVDDAYLLWAQALLASEDPRETVRLLEEFEIRYPDSPVGLEAGFYLGVAYRETRKYPRALERLDAFLERAPNHDLAPFALLERARTLMALERYDEAAAAATRVMEGAAEGELSTEALNARAEARFAGKEFEGARADFHVMGGRARSDDERFNLLLREADCLEAARDFPAELTLLRDALSHEPVPVRADTTRRTGVRVTVGGTSGGSTDRFGRLMMRIGTVHVLEGRLDEAVAAYQRVTEDYPRTPLAAEAQYRIGYAYETVGDDFERARSEYQRVRELGAQTAVGEQATQRLANLERIAKFRSAEGDTAARRAEAGFMVAEQYLLQLDKPERALEEYQAIARDFEGTPHAAKALTAQAWVLDRKLGRPAEAESLLWVVVREYPRTEAQMAARDYLEREGVSVPPELIQPPERPEPPVPMPDDTVAAGPDTLATPPASHDPNAPANLLREAMYGVRPGAGRPPGAASRDSTAAGDSLATRFRSALHDSIARHGPSVVRDSIAGQAPAAGDSAAVRDSSSAPGPGATEQLPPPSVPPAPAVRDTTRAPAPRDTARTAPADSAGGGP